MQDSGNLGCDIRSPVSLLLRIVKMDIMSDGSTPEVAHTLQRLQGKSAKMHLVIEAVND